MAFQYVIVKNSGRGRGYLPTIMPEASKKAVNLAMGTQRIVNFKYWSGQTGWKDMTGELDGTYTLIKEGSHEYAGLTRLRAFATGYQYWLNRYRLD